jgi:nicotinamide-nucleotide amidase
METLIPIADRIAARLKARNETIAIAESSTGGLISAALLAIPGASAYFLGGSVIYTRFARAAFLEIPDPLPGGMRASTEAYATLLASTVRERCKANWGVGETGATGPTGNRYGDAAGHTCIAIDGPMSQVLTLETGSADRVANMRRFATQALEMLEKALG